MWSIDQDAADAAGSMSGLSDLGGAVPRGARTISTEHVACVSTASETLPSSSRLMPPIYEVGVGALDIPHDRIRWCTGND